MTWTLLVRGHGRWSYLGAALASIDRTVGLDFFDRKVLSLDGDSGLVPDELPLFDEVHRLPERRGLTANLEQGWSAVGSDEWVLDWEEDFVAVDLPLEAMRRVLDADRDLAQLALVRQPWSDAERRAGGVLFGEHIAGDVLDEGGWLRQSRIFTLNPYVAHGSLLRSLRPGVEESLTDQLVARGYTFGFWGGEDDDPRVLHIGAEGGMGSAGWMA